METIQAHLYDYPKYYDVVFGSDWKAEYDFLLQCFDKHAKRPVRKLFEPACGTGRLLVKLAKAGYDVAGNDLNPKAVQYCNNRFERMDMAPCATVGDMSAFRLSRPVDAAFNMINSFRHLPTEDTAESHLRCVAYALAEGGIYALGLHLTPEKDPPVGEEHWSARRGNLTVNSSLRTVGIDLKKRNEHLAMNFDVYTPTKSFRIVDTMDYRTYTLKQMNALLRRVPEFEVAETYDFCYEIDQPIAVEPTTEDVVYILRRKS